MIPQAVEYYEIQLESALRNNSTSPIAGGHHSSFKRPTTKRQKSHNRLENMLQRQMPSHAQYKMDTGYYPQTDGTKKDILQWY